MRLLAGPVVLAVALRATAGPPQPAPAARAGVVGAAPAAAPAANAALPDVFGDVMREAGLQAADLGFRRKGTWSRYPDVPHKLPYFDDLLADPTASYEFARTLGNAVEDLLTPEALRAAPTADKPETLYLLGTFLAVDRRIDGFRGFGANLRERKEDAAPTLGEALRRLGSKGAEPAKRPGTRPPTAPKGGADLPAGLAGPLARLLMSLAEAREWIDRGLRRVPPSLRLAVYRSLPVLVATTPDGDRFFPEIEDAAALVDEASLHTGCLQSLAAVQRARREIGAAAPAAGWPAFRTSFATAAGRIDVFAGAAPAAVDASEAPLLSLALGHAGRLAGPLGSTTPTQPLSVALLMDGADEIGDGAADAGPAEVVGSGVARGVLGCGVLYSAGPSATSYATRTWGLGAGMFGLGALVDEGGDDVYRLRNVGEGAGMFGAGLLLDAAGNDRYELLEGDGQGLGAPNGVGILADRSGNDRYRAERSPDKAGKGRADYHSQGQIVASNAQGFGMGRRGDMTDGHAWAGGLGALIDVDGDDGYEAGNFSQGVGYWFGTGLVYDGGGNDTFRSVYFTQGSGAHFAVGALVDEGGDDVHLLEETSGAGLGFGWDVVNALLLDRAGNDRYEAKIISMGCAMVRSNGWLIDEAGDDAYLLDEDSKGFGEHDDDERYATPARISPFAFHLPQLGLFLDLGGRDRYQRRPRAGGPTVPDKLAGDGRAWGRDGTRPPGGTFNLGRGRDVERGRIGWLDPWPRRTAAAGKP